MIQSYNLTENDFRGNRFADHPNSLKGFNDILCLTRPDVIQGIHRKYLEAGADIIETNTFNSQRISMADYGVESLCHEINIEACRLARAVADEYTAKNPNKPRFVVGSVGPTAKTCSIIDEKAQNEEKPFSYELLSSAYEEQIEALFEGGVDAILIETIFDTLNAKAAIEAARSTMKRKHCNVPLMLSFTIATAEGYNMLGQSIIDFISSIGGSDILSVGINCCSDVNMVTPFIEKLGFSTPYYISIYPNAGLPDAKGHYSHTPDMLRKDLWHLTEKHLLNIIGGCCGTTDGHIRKIAEMTEPIEGLRLSPHIPRQFDEIFSEKIRTSQNDENANVFIKNTDKKETNGSILFNAIIDGDSEKAIKGTKQAIENGIAPQDIINGQMISAMAEIGQRFEDGKAFVPQLLMAGRAMKAGLELLKPLLADDTSTSIGRVVIGTVKGDLHDVGKNLVASMLEGCGFDVVNVGIDVSCDKFVEAVKQNNADILCLSALLTTTMIYMKDVIAALEKAGIRDKVKVMVGGAPVTQDFADEIGADGYSDNANSAVLLAKELLGKG
ncbi:MAG: homocysteine S-methyltransferase family protein [Prevotella sp.]|nr:homocysteine S-methyltransferase family protein [Prevotella sp.]